MDLRDKVVLVTGASSGLGQATAQHLKNSGCRVYGTSRSTDAVAPWTMLQLDVTSDVSVASCIDALMTTEGRIDALVNNAGHALVAAFEEASLGNVRTQMEANFFGALRMMQAVLPVMRRQSAGRIVNISSISGVMGVPFLSAYAASKHALEGLSEALSFELHGTAIRVTILEPDGMQTGIRFHQPDSESPDMAARRKRFLSGLAAATARGGSGSDPGLLAQAVREVLASDNPPLRRPVGDAATGLTAARRALPEAQFADLLIARMQLAPD